ncbi:MAG: hypothetical protein WCU88_07165 [Elusimicrobiota bacterium]
MSGYPVLPQLLLFGEAAHESRETIFVKRHAAERANTGSIFAAFEVAKDHAVYPRAEQVLFSDFDLQRSAHSRLFGIESPFAHGLCASYRFAGDAPSLEGFLFYLNINPYLRDVWEDVRKNLSSDDASAGLAALSDDLERARTAPADKWTQIVDIQSGKNRTNFISLMERINVRYVELANKSYLRVLGISGSLKPVASADSKDEGRKWEDSYETLLIPVRDRDMYDNIADVYCRAAEEGKNLVASVGSSHVPGIAKMFQDWSKGRIPLTTGTSSWGDTSLAVDIIDKLSSSGPRDTHLNDMLESLQKRGLAIPAADLDDRFNPDSW